MIETQGGKRSFSIQVTASRVQAPFPGILAARRVEYSRMEADASLPHKQNKLGTAVSWDKSSQHSPQKRQL